MQNELPKFERGYLICNNFGFRNCIRNEKGIKHDIKSMAYVKNVAAFLEYSLSFKSGLHIYNYIDKPDFDMNELVCEARKVEEIREAHEVCGVAAAMAWADAMARDGRWA